MSFPNPKAEKYQEKITQLDGSLHHYGRFRFEYESTYQARLEYPNLDYLYGASSIELFEGDQFLLTLHGSPMLLYLPSPSDPKYYTPS